MKDIVKFTLFVSCPGDVRDELDSINLVADDLNKTLGVQQGYVIEIIEWRRDTYSGKGEDAQDVINTQLNDRYDLLVGIIWSKLGTPTSRDKSGTVEEINYAINNQEKSFLIYFNIGVPASLNDINLGELAKVNQFKSELSERGVLYKEYNTLKNFESLFRINLAQVISDKINSSKKGTITVVEPVSSRKYEGIEKVIRAVDQKEHNDLEEADIFEMVEQTLASIENIGIRINTMAQTVTLLGERMIKRTEEINRFKAIRDDRLRNKKHQIVIDLMAGELDEFTEKMWEEMPSFAVSMSSVAPQYSTVLLFARSYGMAEQAGLVTSVALFRDAVESATHNCANMLEEIMKWPPVTPRLNKSRRGTELVLRELLKEMLNGLELLDEIVK